MLKIHSESLGVFEPAIKFGICPIAVFSLAEFKPRTKYFPTEKKKFWDHFIDTMGNLPLKERLTYFNIVETLLVRLDAGMRGKSIEIPPRDMIVLASANIQGVSENALAKIIGVSSNVLLHTRRNVKAAMANASNGEQATQAKASLDEPELAQYNRLEEISHELKIVKQVLIKKNVRETLNRLPHIKTVIKYYAYFGTIQPLFEELNLPYTPHTINSYNSAIRLFFYSDILNQGLKTLGQKVLFAELVKNHSSLISGEGVEAEISRIAAELFLSEPKPKHIVENYQLKIRIRVILRELLRQEFVTLKGRGEYYFDKDLHHLFLTADGHVAREYADIDPAKTFSSFYKDKICPESFITFLKRIINNGGKETAYSLFSNRDLSLISRQKYIQYGIRFFENILSTNIKNVDAWDIMSIDRHDQLQKAHDAVRVAVKKM